MFRCTFARVGLLLAGVAACSSGPSTPEGQVGARLDVYKERVHDVVEDARRAEQLCAALDRVDAEFERRFAGLRATRRELRAAAQRYETENEELERGLAAMRDEMRAVRRLVEDTHFELRDLLDEREWEAIVGSGGAVFGGK